MSVSLPERLDALERVLGVEHLDAERSAAAHSVLDKARGRLRHGTDFAVVALAGSTGVGKSSLFNALLGDAVSEVGVRRPTTGVAHAAVWPDTGGGTADALLEWLQVGRRHHVSNGDRQGLILLDLPDFDSTEASNRAEVDRVIELVDAMVWVTDPQKYADEAFHHGYVRPLAEHSDVLYFVLNKVDTLDDSARDAVLADFERRLHDDGLAAPRIAASSVTPTLDIADVSATLDAVIDERRVAVDRLIADMRAAATGLATTGAADGVSREARRAMVERLGAAAGADEAGRVVAAQHRKDGRMAMGWPPIRVLERLRRRHPISELPRATVSSVARAEIDLALRDVAESAAGDAAPPWPQALRATAAARADDVAAQLTAVTQETARAATKAPTWWTPVRSLQQLVTLIAVAGVAWLLVAAVLGGFFQLDTDPLLIDTPGLDWIPLPSLMVLGGALAGLAIAWIARLLVGVAARRRAASMRGRMLDRVDSVVGDSIVSALDAVVAQQRSVAADLAVVAAP